jgi:uncharacterized repeat protein (TIGR03847 family)
MPRRIFSFDEPDRFVAGTVGEPGGRTFFLQARDGRRVVSVVLEKVQVAVLAERMTALLDELGRHGLELPASGTGTDGLADTAPLDEPLVEAFRAGTLTLTWDGGRERIIVEARELQPQDEVDEAGDAGEIDEPDEPVLVADDDDDGPDLIRVVMHPATARGFADRATAIVASGRPPCPLCGQPLDPLGHLCPRRNGYLN